MDRGLLTSMVVGFLAPVVLFSPLNNAGAWFAAWQKHDAPAAPAARAAAAPLAVVAEKPKQAHARGERRLASKPRPADVRVAARGSRVAEKAVAVSLAKPLDPKEQLARTIDPAKQPDWYLVDPTLKRGDVLFLADKVVVFRGRKIGNLADYVPVSRTRMLSRKERGLIEKLASGPRPPASPARAADLKPNRLTIASAKAD